MLNKPGFRNHITTLHPSLVRELIIPIGALVAVPDVFGYAQVGTITAYGYSSDYARELRGEKVYTIRGTDSAVLGLVERDFDQITVIAAE